jgi:hypothetical protein
MILKQRPVTSNDEPTRPVKGFRFHHTPRNHLHGAQYFLTKLTVAQLFNKFLAFDEPQLFIAALTTAQHRSAAHSSRPPSLPSGYLPLQSSEFYMNF